MRRILLWGGIVVLWMSAAGAAAASIPANPDAAAQWDRTGRSLFQACEFRQAARSFEKALAQAPATAARYYWLGKAYARLAEVSSPLSATKNARKARRNLELAVSLEPRNPEYLRELFEFYLDSPEWFNGGLSRAAALAERIGSGDPGADAVVSQQLASSRDEYSGPAWWARRSVLTTVGIVGRIVPQP